jgi:RHS repeat-associated protein
VVAAVGRTGTLAFRVAYDAYGEARHLPAKDINGDGKVDSADTAIAQAAVKKRIGEPGYNPDADWDRDGTVTSTDIAQFGSRSYIAALPQGQLAQPGSATQPAATTTTAAANAARAANARSDFNIGFCGYRFNGDIGAYTVRFRHYDPTPGMCRWLERDPAGYQDGPSLYSYLGRNPMAGTDPYGLWSTGIVDPVSVSTVAQLASVGLILDIMRVCLGVMVMPDGRAMLEIMMNVIHTALNAFASIDPEIVERFLWGVAKGAVIAVVAMVVVAHIPGAAVFLVAAGIVGLVSTAIDLCLNWDSYSAGDIAELLGELLGGAAAGGIVSRTGGTSSWFNPRYRGSGSGGSTGSATRGGGAGTATGRRTGGACFLAGTLVLTATPALAAPIESIEAGATVASVDPATGEATTAIVSATPARLFEGTIYDITVDPGDPGEPGGGDETTISATGEHPFLVARAGPRAAALDTRADPEAVALVEPLDTRDRTGQDRTGHGRWVPASDLAEGDAVRTMSPQGVAGTATVTKIRARHAVVPVYNLTVEGTSRYLVGACGVVVHNKGEGAGGLTSLRQRYVDEVLLLEDIGLNARAAGMSVDDTARMLHGLRRELGRKFKELTPALERERIRVRNLQKYGDELGPTIEYFRSRGESWQEILDSACRPGGRDLGY